MRLLVRARNGTAVSPRSIRFAGPWLSVEEQAGGPDLPEGRRSADGQREASPVAGIAGNVQQHRGDD